jgi:hypothetical protein
MILFFFFYRLIVARILGSLLNGWLRTDSPFRHDDLVHAQTVKPQPQRISFLTDTVKHCFKTLGLNWKFHEEK